MKEYIFETTKADLGKRIDKFLMESLNDESLSRAKIQQLIKQGYLKIDAVVCDKPSSKIKILCKLEFCIPNEEEKTLKKCDIALDILHVDDDIIVVNKPAFLVTHPGAGKEEKSLVGAIISKYTLSSIGAPIRPGVVHRLDKGTEGIIVFARNDKAYHNLVKQFSKKEITKHYRAIVCGVPNTKKGKIIVPITRDKIHRKKMKPTDIKHGKEAISEFEVIKTFTNDKYSLLKITPVTGRTHQIRVHLSYIGNPLLGDKLYGGKLLKPFEDEGFFLQSYYLKIIHPTTKKQMFWEIPPSKRFEKIINYLVNNRV